MVALKFMCPHCERWLSATAVRNHKRRFAKIGKCPPTQEEIRARRWTKKQALKVKRSRLKPPADPLSKCDLEYICREWT